MTQGLGDEGQGDLFAICKCTINQYNLIYRATPSKSCSIVSGSPTTESTLLVVVLVHGQPVLSHHHQCSGRFALKRPKDGNTVVLLDLY